MIEIVAAIVVLCFGVLGAATMLATGTAQNVDNLARDGANGVAREGLERLRQVGYAELGTTAGTTTWRAAVSDGAIAGTDFKVTRRGVTYTLSHTACAIDDPTDGSGAVGPTNCSYVPGGSGGGGGGGGGSISGELQLLGVPLGTNVSGEVANKVCQLVGTGNTTLVNGLTGTTSQLLALAESGAALQVCPDGSGTSRQLAFDPSPDDMKRATVTVTWAEGPVTRTVTQSALIPNPGDGA